MKIFRKFNGENFQQLFNMEKGLVRQLQKKLIVVAGLLTKYCEDFRIFLSHFHFCYVSLWLPTRLYVGVFVFHSNML